jgi:hypothetical protein
VEDELCHELEHHRLDPEFRGRREEEDRRFLVGGVPDNQNKGDGRGEMGGQQRFNQWGQQARVGQMRQ